MLTRGRLNQPKAPATSAAGSASLASYFQNPETGVQDGNVRVIPITTPKGTFNVWTKQFGNNPKIKVLLLNGGPGATHEYFECFENFLPKEGIEFIYYDQLGCGNSDNPKDTAMWSLPRYVEEVEQVRQALKLDSTNFYLLGHSWGGILAAEYAFKYQQHLKGLIISNMMMSCPAYGKYADEVLAKQMKPEVLKEIRAIEAKKDFSNPRYMALLEPNFYAEHLCRIVPNPEPVTPLAGQNQPVAVRDHAGPQRVRHLGQAHQLGPGARPAQAARARAQHRRQVRHHGPRPHAHDCHQSAARQLPHLPPGQPHEHVRRPANVFHRPAQVPESRGRQAPCSRARICSRDSVCRHPLQLRQPSVRKLRMTALLL